MFRSSYIPTYFKAKELVHPSYYEIWGEDALNLFDPHVLRMLDRFRADYGQPITINNYQQGYINSGLRTPECDVGANRSYHKKHVAFDLKAENLQSLRMFIKENSEKYLFQELKTLIKPLLGVI